MSYGMLIQSVTVLLYVNVSLSYVMLIHSVPVLIYVNKLQTLLRYVTIVGKSLRFC